MKYEGSAKDEKRDRAMARKRKESLREWENSPEDKRMDKAAQKKLDVKKKRK